MQVQLFHPVVHPNAVAAAGEVMRSGWIGMGPKVAAFEAAFGAYLSLEGMAAVAVNSCTSALHLALALLRLKPGTEVITTALTFVATNQVLLWEGLVPVFADVEAATGNISVESVRRKMSERTGAVMAVHFAGEPCDVEGLKRAAGGRAVIEDCAHACGAVLAGEGGRRVGASGNWCAFSFGPTKALTTVDGGMLVLPAERAEEARAYRSLGQSSDIYRRVRSAGGGGAGRFWEYEVNGLGRRYHMSDVNAAIGLAHLPLLDRANRRRAEIAAAYDAALVNVPGVRLRQRSAGSANYMYVILAEARDRLAEALQGRGVTVGVHYRPNTHFAIFEGGADLPETEAFFARTLSLPLYPELTDDEVAHVAGAIREGW